MDSSDNSMPGELHDKVHDGDWICLASLGPAISKPIVECQDPALLRSLALELAKLARSRLSKSYDVLDRCIDVLDADRQEPPSNNVVQAGYEAYRFAIGLDDDLDQTEFLEARLATAVAACCRLDPMKAVIVGLTEYREYASFYEAVDFHQVASMVKQVLKR